jgi:L-amino acid N-acyltransferase YncA
MAERAAGSPMGRAGGQASGPQIVIRDAADADLPEIVSIYNAAIPGRLATADTEPVSLASRLGWFAEHGPAHHPIWVAELDGKIAGWLSFTAFYGRPAYQATAEISIYLAPAHQSRGLGRMLLKRAVAEAPGLGLRTLLGFVFGHNAPSLRLFEGLGFARWGHLPRVADLDGIERDLVILGRRVDKQEE